MLLDSNKYGVRYYTSASYSKTCISYSVLRLWDSGGFSAQSLPKKRKTAIDVSQELGIVFPSPYCNPSPFIHFKLARNSY